MEYMVSLISFLLLKNNLMIHDMAKQLYTRTFSMMLLLIHWYAMNRERICP